MRYFYPGDLQKKKPEKNDTDKGTSKKILPNPRILELCGKAKSEAYEGNFIGAFEKIDEARNIAFHGKGTVLDRSQVEETLKSILVLRYKDSVIRRYETLLEQYRLQNDDGILLSMQADRYPRREGYTDKQYFESYIRSLAIRQIDEDTKDDRYGGKMHVIIHQILYEYLHPSAEKEKSEKIRQKFWGGESRDDR